MKQIMLCILLLINTSFAKDLQLYKIEMPFFTKNSFASPTLSIQIKGKSYIFIVDTGAPLHVIDKKIANDLGFSEQTFKTKFLIDRAELNSQYFVSQKLPPDFSDSGIAGILSPQMLLTTVKSVQIDLPRELLILNKRKGNNYKDKLIEIKIPGPDSIKLNYYFMQVKIGAEKLQTLVDTGAEDFVVDISSSLGQKIKHLAVLSGTQIGDIYGTSTSTYIVKNQKVDFAKTRVSADIYLKISNKNKPADSLIGTKYLKNCLIHLTKADSYIYCKDMKH